MTGVPFAAAAFSAALTVLFALPAADVSAATTGLRNQRYCEVIPSVVGASTVTTYIFNTQGVNLCPADQWSALAEAEVNREFGSQKAKLNGPRYWTMDAIDATGSSTTGRSFTFGGIAMLLRGQLVTPLGVATVGEQFYVPNTVQRQTVYTYEARQPMYELVDPDNNVYVMQSYAQIVDKSLTIDQLPALGHTLSLPTGWRFSVKRPRHSVALITNGTAYVVNDNLANSYERMNKPTIALSAGCVRRGSEIRVHIGGDTATTRVSVGARTVKRTTASDFTVTVARGRRLSVLAHNDAGTARAAIPVCTTH